LCDDEPDPALPLTAGFARGCAAGAALGVAPLDHAAAPALAPLLLGDAPPVHEPAPPAGFGFGTLGVACDLCAAAAAEAPPDALEAAAAAGVELGTVTTVAGTQWPGSSSWLGPSTIAGAAAAAGPPAAASSVRRGAAPRADASPRACTSAPDVASSAAASAARSTPRREPLAAAPPDAIRARRRVGEAAALLPRDEDDVDAPPMRGALPPAVRSPGACASAAADVAIVAHAAATAGLSVQTLLAFAAAGATRATRATRTSQRRAPRVAASLRATRPPAGWRRCGRRQEKDEGARWFGSTTQNCNSL
jgi:hypothetical protein